jgi:hypothetical protein
MEIAFLGQHEIRSEYQVIFWYTFSIEGISKKEEDFLIEFIHSSYFKEFGKPSIVKQSQSTSDRFLQGAFNLGNLDITNFKAFDRKGLVQFFKEYSQSPDWGEDRKEFVTIMKRFGKLLEKEKNDHFFLISKEWFRQGDQILNADSEFYTYYFLIMWLNIGEKTINICEWNYD